MSNLNDNIKFKANHEINYMALAGIGISISAILCCAYFYTQIEPIKQNIDKTADMMDYIINENNNITLNNSIKSDLQAKSLELDKLLNEIRISKKNIKEYEDFLKKVKTDTEKEVKKNIIEKNKISFDSDDIDCSALSNLSF